LLGREPRFQGRIFGIERGDQNPAGTQLFDGSGASVD
jgi:hypothetical protein